MTDARTTEAATGKGAKAGPVAERLESLRAIANAEPKRAQEDAWGWIEELGQQRDGDTLARLFELGTPPASIDGPTEGILVTTLTNPLVDVPVRMLTSGWMPWTGKTFDAANASGVNQMTEGSELPAKLLWPLYGMREAEDGKHAFDFKTGIVKSAIPPDMQVLKIEYEHVSDNPDLVIKQILDELVQLVPDTYLGRILFKLPVKGFVNIGYFALRQPA
jgi:hypothetical protein